MCSDHVTFEDAAALCCGGAEVVEAFRAVRALKPEHVTAPQVCYSSSSSAIVTCCCTSATSAALLCAANCTCGCIMHVSCARLKSGGTASRCCALPSRSMPCLQCAASTRCFLSSPQQTCLHDAPACALVHAPRSTHVQTCTVAREAHEPSPLCRPLPHGEKVTNSHTSSAWALHPSLPMGKGGVRVYANELRRVWRARIWRSRGKR